MLFLFLLAVLCQDKAVTSIWQVHGLQGCVSALSRVTLISTILRRSLLLPRMYVNALSRVTLISTNKPCVPLLSCSTCVNALSRATFISTVILRTQRLPSSCVNALSRAPLISTARALTSGHSRDCVSMP